MCQIDVLYGKSLIIDFLDEFLKKRTAIRYIPIFTIIPSGLFSGSVLIINRKMMIMTVMICS